MAIELPVIGQPNWGEPLNAALRELDSRVGVPGDKGDPGEPGKDGTVTPEMITLRDESVAAKNTTVAARDVAVTAKDDAVTAKVAAQAVGATNDAIMAGVAADPASAFSTRLSKSYVAPGSSHFNDGSTAQKPFLEVISRAASASLHLTNATGFTGPYILGVGKDVQGQGIELPNKANGSMVVGTQRATVTDISPFMKLVQQSATGPLLRLEMQASNSADLLQLLSFSGELAPGDDKNLLYVGTGMGEAGRIAAGSGKIRWRRDIELQDSNAATTTFLRLYSNGGVPENQRDNAILHKKGLEFYSYSGSAGQWWQHALSARGSSFYIEAGGTTGEVGVGERTTLIRFQNKKIGFWDAAPVSRPTGVAVTVEAIHAALVSLGLIAS